MKRINSSSHTIGWLLIGLLGVGSLLLAQPLPAAGQQAARAKTMAPRGRSQMLVTTDWLAKHLNDPKVVLLHIARERAHYEAGHIPGARFVAWNEIIATRNGVANELPPVEQLQKLFERLGVGDEARIVVYGDAAGLSAARAYFTLDYLGHGERTALLDGGLEKWKAEKRPLSTEAPEIKPAHFTVRLNPQLLVSLEVMRDLSWIAAHSDQPEVMLIDSRPANDYAGSPALEGRPRTGHIPGSVNIYWMQHLRSREDPQLLPVTELRKLYEAVGARPGQKMVTYCNTGVQASHSYFVAKYLGYDVAMYDGSFSEWSKAEGTPVTTGKERR